MNDAKLFDLALAKAGGRITDLAKACSVSRATVHSWRKKATSKGESLPRYARVRLNNVIITDKPLY